MRRYSSKDRTRHQHTFHGEWSCREELHYPQSRETVKYSQSVAVLGTSNDCVGEGQQKFLSDVFHLLEVDIMCM
jgi:hypothetical protein